MPACFGAVLNSSIFAMFADFHMYLGILGLHTSFAS